MKEKIAGVILHLPYKYNSPIQKRRITFLNQITKRINKQFRLHIILYSSYYMIKIFPYLKWS